MWHLFFRAPEWNNIEQMKWDGQACLLCCKYLNFTQEKINKIEYQGGDAFFCWWNLEKDHFSSWQQKKNKSLEASLRFANDFISILFFSFSCPFSQEATLLTTVVEGLSIVCQELCSLNNLSCLMHTKYCWRVFFVFFLKNTSFNWKFRFH